MPVTIRTATEQDAPDLAVAAYEIWSEHYTPIIGAEQVEYMTQTLQSAQRMIDDMRNGFTYLIASDGRDIIGYCAISPQEDALFLSKLYIHKEYRGRGIARKFLDLVFEQARGHKLPQIRLTVNKDNHSSIAAYEHMGFEIEDSVVTDIGGGFVMDDYVMVLELVTQ